MLEHKEYGKSWLLDESKGQLGLLRENHYKPLFDEKQREFSFQPEDRWLDIGANIGAFAVRAAEFVETVVAFEPEPLCMGQLLHHVGINHASNVTCIQGAVIAEDSRSVPLSISNNYSSTHRVGKIRGRESINVPAFSIDSVLEDYATNKIKMDCEGSELEILEAMSFSYIDEIIFEYHFSMFKNKPWERFWNILSRMEDDGLTVLKKPGMESKTWHTIAWARRGGRR